MIFLGVLLLAIPLKAQFIEFGGGLGVSHYTGDLNRYPRIGKSRIAGTGIYRMNLSQIVSVRFGLAYGSVAGDDQNPYDELGVQRQHAFSNSFFELSSVFEYHFIDYRSDNKRIKWSPYAFLGIGFLRLNNPAPAYEDFSQLQFVLPMGGGVKYILSKRLTLGIEFGVRKTYFDYLDGISDGDVTIKPNYRFGNPNDDDWYFYSGVSLTYVLYTIPCPFPYRPNRSFLDRIRPY